MNKLTTPSLIELTEVFERSSSSLTDLEGLRIQGVPGWDLSKYTHITPAVTKHWLNKVGYAGTMPAYRGEEKVPVEITEVDGTGPSNFQYRCPETFRMRRVSANAIAVYTVKPEVYLDYVAELFGIHNAARSGIKQASISGCFWKLGSARIGPSQVPIWFVRDLGVKLDQVLTHLNDSSVSPGGLIVSSGLDLPKHIQLPKNFRIVRLQEALVEFTRFSQIDFTHLERLMSQPAGEQAMKTSKVYFNESTSTLSIATIKEPWKIGGEKQAKAVQCIYKAACSDIWELPHAEALDAAYKGAPESERKGKTIQHLFKGNTKWEIYLRITRRGHIAFNLAPD